MLLFAGCASTQMQPLTMNDPANPQAREAVTRGVRPMLAVDATTRKTDELLTAQEAQNPQTPTTHKTPDMDMSGMNMNGTDQSKKKTSSKLASPSVAKVYYTCPMHPQIHEEKPGQCPICGMTLIQKTVEGK